jgi:hypothetical protein
LVANIAKEEFRGIESHDEGGSKPYSYTGYPVVKKKIFLGRRRFLLDFLFQRWLFISSRTIEIHDEAVLG